MVRDILSLLGLLEKIGNKMKTDYQVLDNFLSVDEFYPIKQLLTGRDFPWFFQPTVAYSDDDSSFYFTNLLFSKCSPTNFFHVVEPILGKLNLKSLIRVKCNLYPNLGKKFYNPPHIDYDFSHYGAIFYINTNDGKTILEDGTEIDSIENRLLIFDASKPHNSTHCTDLKARININFNYF